MINFKRSFSDEFEVCRYRQGLKLVRPTQKSRKIQPASATLSDLKNLPCSFFFLDLQSRLQYSNAVQLEFLYANSLNEVIGKTAFDILHLEFCKKIILND